MSLSYLENQFPSPSIERIVDCDGAVVATRIEGIGYTELQVGVRPSGEGRLDNQIWQIYGRLLGLLRRQGASRGHVVAEKVYLQDTHTQAEAFEAARAAFYRGAGELGLDVPAVTYLREPPCESGVLCELQARVLIPAAGEELTVRAIEGLRAPASGQVISCRGIDHIHLYNLTGGQAGDGLSYADQMTEVFDAAEAALEREGATFVDVVRTWIYIDEMERDYDDLNRVRSAFFKRVGVERMPASTGIQAGVFPADRGGAMDVYALRAGQEDVEVAQMHAATLNEAWSYGSAFARGMTVTAEGRTTAYISGTASIDETGQVVHVGDIEGQVNRMLVNVERLLAGSGMGLGNAIRVTTYLKEPEFFETFKRVCAEWSFPTDVAHTICHADVCRPDWLVEMELEAVV